MSCSICLPRKDAYASDVICVIGPNGLFATDFYVKFSFSVYNEFAIINHTNTLTTVSDKKIETSNSILECQNDESSSLLQSLQQSYNGNIDVFINDNIRETSFVVGNDELLYFLENGNLSSVPSEKTLKSLQLIYGLNNATLLHRDSGQRAQFQIWLYDYKDSILVSDIDGTITISDIRGYFETVYLGRYTHVHDGLVSLISSVHEQLKYHILYLTSRPITHKQETRNLLIHATDTSTGSHLPKGALIVNKQYTFETLYGEVIAGTAKIYKSNVLLKLVDVFHTAGRSRNDTNPLAFGIGNKLSDAKAYYTSGLSPSKILLIDTTSTLKIWIGPDGNSSPNSLSNKNHNKNKQKNEIIGKNVSFKSYRDLALWMYITEDIHNSKDSNINDINIQLNQNIS